MVEVLVACSVLGLLTLMGLGTVVPGLKVTQQAEEGVTAQREVIVAFDSLVTEMSVLDRRSVSHATGTLSYISDKPVNSGNAPIDDTKLDNLGVLDPFKTWTKHVVLRLRGGHLMKREYTYAKGQEIWPVIGSELQVLADTPGMSEKRFAKNIELFEAIPAGRSRIYLKVRAVSRKGSKPAACELALQIQMRGSSD